MTSMAMTLRLTEAQTEALRAVAKNENRSMQEVALSAVDEYVSRRSQRLNRAIDRVRTEDAQLLERLAK